MPAIDPNMLYGSVRGGQDAREEARRQQAFDLDQQIRQQALSTEQELGPLRRRTAALNLQNAEQLAPVTLGRQRNALKLEQLDIAGRERLNEELKKASQQKKQADEALARFMITKDPQPLAQAISEIYPDIGLKNVKAVRNEDGSISFSADGMPTETISAGTAPDGTPYTVEDAVGIRMMQMLNPLAMAQARMERASAAALQKSKNESAERVARIRAGGGESSDAKRISKEVARVPAIVNSALRTSISQGNFLPGFGDPKDAELQTLIKSQAEGLLNDPNSGVERASEAVQQALSDVSEAYDKTAKLADRYAAQLAQQGINPRDQAELDAAAKKGVPEAMSLKRVLASAKKNFGFRVQSHMQGNLKIGSERVR